MSSYDKGYNRGLKLGKEACGSYIIGEEVMISWGLSEDGEIVKSDGIESKQDDDAWCDGFRKGYRCGADGGL